jgi:hypothetical protein
MYFDQPSEAGLEPKVVNITAQFEKVTKKKNGEGQIVFNFGLESLAATHQIEKWNNTGGVNFIVAVAPYQKEGK